MSERSVTACPLRRALTILAATLAVLPLADCGDATPGKPRILLDWFAQPNQAGIWAAQMRALPGPPLTVMPGGPRIQTIPQVAAGSAEFGATTADDLLLAAANGAPVVAVAAIVDDMSYTLVYHPDPQVKSIGDLRHRTFAVALGAAYWEWVKVRYHFDGVRETPLSGDLTLFRRDPDRVQQGVSTILPYRLDVAGIPWAQFRVKDLGYRPYYVLFTTRRLLAERPALVRAVVARVIAGWRSYLANPASVDAFIVAANGQLSPAVMARSVQDLRKDGLPADRSRIGCMSAARWHLLASQLSESHQLEPAFDERTAYDASIVNGCR